MFALLLGPGVILVPLSLFIQHVLHPLSVDMWLFVLWTVMQSSQLRHTQDFF